MVTHEQKRVIDAILCLFETGWLPSNEAYATVAVLPDGAGISYGKHQSTDRADTLDEVVWRYIDLKGEYAFALRPFLDELHRDETAKLDPNNLPPWAVQLIGLLRNAAEDPLMRCAQDDVFDEQYWEPAYKQAGAMGLLLPLSYAVVYDSFVHGSFSRVRRMFPERPPAGGGDEKTWTEAYVLARRRWLAGHSNEILNNTVYRMDAFIDLIGKANWSLSTPLSVRGVEIE